MGLTRFSLRKVAIKVKIPRMKGDRWRLSTSAIRAIVAAFLIVCIVCFGVFAYYYVKYQKIVDAKMRGQIFSNAAKIYAAPSLVEAGRPLNLSGVISQLRKAGYTDDSERSASRIGTYRATANSIEVKPGPESFHNPEGALIRVKDGNVDRIASINNGSELQSYELEPQLVTGLFDRQERSKQRLITYEDMPRAVVDAIISIEDRRFFQHSGINYYRLAEAAFIDVFHPERRRQGGGTLTMQLARQPGFFVSRERTGMAGVKRKLAEMLIAVELEQRLSKKQILELYLNSADMGMRGSFDIRGFGEAAQAYFGKDIKNLSLPEAALLAGIVNGPTLYSPYRHPDKALERRNLVLEAMFDNGTISRAQADVAKATPLKLAPPNVEASDAPYFVDMVRDQLTAEYKDNELNNQGYRIYTTLNIDLQRAAAEAIEIGMKEVDALVTKQRTKRVRVGKGKAAKYETTIIPGPKPQVALIALDPHTGKVLALSGGRNYGQSQLNHAVATRPTGSIFKPFVYATAMQTAVEGAQPVFTPASVIDDVPTVFEYEDKVYTPKNFKQEYFGQVSASYALAHSLNNATVKLAEEVGYGKVADLARAAGIKSVKPTPAMALGSYDASPMDMAGAYTVFANGGVRISPIMLTSLRDSKGDVIEDFTTDQKPVLDPRVTYVMTTMLQGVLNYGTAAGVRARGFSAPAAGKTGTSHDAWFAGYTSNLLCIVWVGNDDYSDLKLEGAHSAAPIWAEFMKRAMALPEFKDVTEFAPPAGVVDLRLDKVTNYISTPTCPQSYPASFIAGTEPRDTCDHVASDQRGFFQKLFGLGPKPLPPPPVSNPSQAVPMPSSQPAATVAPPPAPPGDEQKKKKGFFGKIFGAIKGDNKDNNSNPPPNPPAQPR